MPASFRSTSSGACARCGAYRESGHTLPDCLTRPAEPFKRGKMRRAGRDSRNSSAMRSLERLDRALMRRL